MSKTTQESGKSGKRPSVYRVATLAGVSPGTVSRVLNNRGRVHDDTRTKVLDIARSIGFKPQAQVRTHQVAVVAEPQWHTRHDGTYSQALAARIAFALCRNGMAMMTPENPLEDLKNVYLDGVIVLGEYPDFYPTANELLKHTPIVMIDDFSGNENYHVLRSDCKASGLLAAECFAKKGRKRLAFVGDPNSHELIRMEGYKAGITQAGLEVEPELFVLRGDEVSLYAAVSRVIRLGADAIYVPGSSYEALEALSVINNVLGKKIPQEIALIGGEVHGVSEFLSPPMTTIEEPLRDIAERAVTILASLIADPSIKPNVETMPVRLLQRESH